MRAPTTIAAATIFVAAIAASTFTPAHATLYRWTDERGVVNYSDKTPPKNAAAKDVRVVPQDRLSIYSPDRATLDMVKPLAASCWKWDPSSWCHWPERSLYQKNFLSRSQ